MKITLIGSAKYLPIFDYWNEELTKRGHSIYSLGVRRRVDDDLQKKVLDAVHLTKIQNSDAIILINQEDYIGESTMGELLFSMLSGRQLFCTQKPKTRSWGIGFCTIAPARALLMTDLNWDNWVLTEDDNQAGRIQEVQLRKGETMAESIARMDQASSDQPSPYLPLTSPLVERAYQQGDPGPQKQKYSSASKY